jgi:hypothetical protein
LVLRTNLADNTSRNTFFNLDTGAVGTVGTGHTALIEFVGNGWYRCSISANATVSGARFMLIAVAETDNVFEYTGDGTSGIFIWQAQHETGSVATSPIVTTAGTASRVADVVSLTGASSLIGQTQGSVYVEAEIGALLGTVVRNFLEASDGSNNNRFFVNFTSAASNTLRAGTVANNVVQADFRQEVMSTGIFKLAYGYESTDSALYFNGATTTEVSDNAFTFTAPLSQINIGSGQAGTLQPIAWIRSVALFPTRLSNAQLETLTT